MESCAFDTLFTKNVPHILEKIFLSLDYETFNKCRNVSNAWNKLLTSESFQRKAKSVFQVEIEKEQEKLYWAVKKSNSEEIIKLLSDDLLDVNYWYHNLYGHKTHKYNLMILAAMQGNKNVVQLLLDRGADCDTAIDWGGTPLYFAALHDRLDVVKVLLDAGADPKKTADDGHTGALYIAVRNSLEMVKLLVNRGANCTPAHINRARELGKTDIITFLNGGGFEDPTNGCSVLKEDIYKK